MELKVSVCRQGEGAQSFSFVARERVQQKQGRHVQEANAQRRIPNGYLPKANSSFLFIIVCQRHCKYYFLLSWAAHSIMDGF